MPHTLFPRHAALLSLTIAGCTVGPDPRPPDLSSRTGPAWRQPAGDGVAAARQELGQWWRQLGSDELTALSARLLLQNLSLAESRQRIVVARAARGIADAERLPQLQGDAGYLRAGTGERSLDFQGPPPGRQVEVYAAGVTAGWELDLWGRVRRLVEAADADIDVRVEDYRAAAVALLGELARAYVDASTQHQRLQATTRLIELQRQTVTLLQSRLDAGNGARLDVEQARRELATTAAQVPTLQLALAAAENRVAVLVGERPTDGLVQASAALQLPPAIGLGLPADLLSRRPDVRARERSLAAAVARIGVAEAERYPRLSLGGTLALRAQNGDALWSGVDGLSWSIGPSLSLPLFTGGRVDAAVAERTAEATAARLGLERVLLAAIGEVETAACGVVRSRQRLDQLQTAVVAAQNAAELARQLYAAGSRPLLLLLDAQRAQVAAEDAVLLGRQTALVQSIELYLALGGGYEPIGLDGALAHGLDDKEPVR